MLRVFFEATALVVVLSVAFWTGVYVAEKNRYDLLAGPTVADPKASLSNNDVAVFDAEDAEEQLGWIGQGSTKFRKSSELASWLETHWLTEHRLLRPSEAAKCYARVFNAQAKRWAREVQCATEVVAIVKPFNETYKVDAWVELLPHVDVYEIRGTRGGVLKLEDKTRMWPLRGKASKSVTWGSISGVAKFLMVIDVLSSTFNEAKELHDSFNPYLAKNMVYFVEGMVADVAWDVRRHLSGHYILTECPREKGLWAISYLEALHVVAAMKALPWAVPTASNQRFWGGPAVRAQRELEGWLAQAETKYGGFIEGLLCPGKTKCQGGDRFSGKFHNYAACYAQVILALAPYWERAFECGITPLVGEVGILAGSGLATWSDLFPGAQIHGFDLNLSVVISKLPFLSSVGAFSAENVDLHPWDQMGSMAPQRRLLQKLAQGGQFVMAIDDGAHTLKTVRATWDTFKGIMHRYGAFIIEDMGQRHQVPIHDFFQDTPFQMTVCPHHEELWVVTTREVAPLLFPL